MKIIHVNFSGRCGGAAIAASRIHRALIKSGVKSVVWCARNADESQKIHCLKSYFFQKMDSAKNIAVQKIAARLEFSGRSYNFFPSRLVRQLNASDADVIHLHWVNAEMVSIAQLAKINKPVVWTLHDMWAFCGAEHYTESTRYLEGYLRESYKPLDNSQKLKLDLDRWVFRRKQREWANWCPHLVTCSNWLGNCARESLLCKNWPVDVVSNCLDLNLFRSMDSFVARQGFGLYQKKKIILFGAVSPSDARKGGDLLAAAIRQLKNFEQYQLVVFGADSFEIDALLSVTAVGSIGDPYQMAQLYNAADVMCVPSRQDNLPNTIAESLACCTPIVAFNIGGIPDMVEHQVNGYLAKPFDTEDFSRGIEWVLARSRRLKVGCQKAEDGGHPFNDATTDQLNNFSLSANARRKAETMFSGERVAAAYKKVYQQAIDDFKKS